MVCSINAVRKLGSTRASLQFPGPIKLGGVGDIETESVHGVYQVRLPLNKSKEVRFAGVCLDKITKDFPMYPLDGKVTSDIHHAFIEAGGNTDNLPILPKQVGGQVDFIIGSKYLRYHPKIVFELPSGLQILRSVFTDSTGCRGVVGGPHEIFTAIQRFHGFASGTNLSYFTQQYTLFRNGYQVNPDIYMFNIRDKIDHVYEDENENAIYEPKDFDMSHVLVSRKQKIFEAAEDAGTDTSYRCVNCRQCKKCKDGCRIESISFKEEIEQDLINKSVKINLKSHRIIAHLPLLENPVSKLAPNKDIALAVYRTQVKRLNQHPIDKCDVIKSEAMLQQLGFVEFTINLPDHIQEMLRDSEVQNYIPWRVVWKLSSVSTPCRIVFDASQPTSSGHSLNDILPKGINNMNVLLEIVIRWMTQVVALHTDVKKMYNTIKLHEDHWCFQRYIWDVDLDPTKIPVEKILTTLFYGVKPSGNQAEVGLRETAKMSQEEYPDICETVHKDTYVDDCLSGAPNTELAHEKADGLTVVLSKGGFTLKGFTFSGEHPPEDLTDDGESVNIAGMCWFSKEDKIQLNVGDLNFAPKHRGKKQKSINQVPLKLTRRHCAAKTGEVFDLTGRITPIVARLKLDNQELVRRKLSWDDVIPDDLRAIWINNFEMIQELQSLKLSRCVVPEDAVSLEVTTIDMGDATCSLACVAIYARYLRKNGEFSCQLIFGRSKVMPADITQPRAELLAAKLNAQASHVVKRSLGKYHAGCVKLSDSQIALHWINSSERPLKQWVRNNVIEICRLSDVSGWYYIHSKQMVADIGTRRNGTVQDVTAGSTWVNGLDWMKKPTCEFPMKSVEELVLSEKDKSEYKKETPKQGSFEHMWYQEVAQDSVNVAHHIFLSTDEMEQRYLFSNYLVDPNKHRFKTVVRIVAIVKHFIRKLIQKVKNKSQEVETSQGQDFASSSAQSNNDMPASTKPMIILSDDEIMDAQNYFFTKATNEVKHFGNVKRLKKISKEVDGILYYTGRILSTQEFNIAADITPVMKDLTSSTFCVPIVDKDSPVAISIINEIHWHHEVARHRGVETLLRYVMQIAYILEGRQLVKYIRNHCERCRFLRKKTIDVTMGPISKHSLSIAPAFYVTMLDIAGPFKAFTPHNKRSTIKIYYIIFCCATTSTTNIKVMNDYTTSSFIQAFIRFACEVGYPKTLLPDPGSQLIKGCESMRLNFSDLRYHLHLKMNVDFQPCPVGGHHVHGKVERKIREIKNSIQTKVINERLSILEWETLGSEIANSINDLPIGLGSKVADLENLDLLTPNRLKFGRNNNRSPVGPLELTCNLGKFLTQNKEIFDAWFECWLTSYVPSLIEQPKWFKKDLDVKKGDIILFLKEDKAISGRYQFGIIDSVEHGRDNLIRTIVIKYRNHNENIDRKTKRSVRHIVMIHEVDELDLFKQLSDAAIAADAKFKSNDSAE